MLGEIGKGVGIGTMGATSMWGAEAARAAKEGKAAAKRWKAEGGQSLDKLAQMREVLERWKFSGINRKLQLKPLKWETRRVRIRRGGASRQVRTCAHVPGCCIGEVK